MRNISKSIFEILENKQKLHSKVFIDEPNSETINYIFEKNGIFYSATFQTYNTGGSTYTISRNGERVRDKSELFMILEMAKKIFVPTDPDLKKAMSEMSRRSMSKIIEREYPSNEKDI